MLCSDVGRAPQAGRAPGGRWRAACQGIVAVVATVAMAGCGFHLRGEAAYPFDSIYISVPVAPPLALELTRAVAAASKAQVVDGAGNAQVVLDVPSVVDDKEVLSLSSGGSVREYQLIKRVQFRLHDKDGNDWMTPARSSCGAPTPSTKPKCSRATCRSSDCSARCRPT